MVTTLCLQCRFQIRQRRNHETHFNVAHLERSARLPRPVGVGDGDWKSTKEGGGWQTMYDELIRALRGCVLSKPCNGCPYYDQDGPTEKCATMNIAAADAIEELLQKMQQLSQWIPVTEQSIHSGWYLVACNEWGGSAVRKAIFDEVTRMWMEFPCGGPKDITKFVTHYMPLPEPPKEAEQACTARQ